MTPRKLPTNLCILITSKEEEEAVLTLWKKCGGTYRVAKYLNGFNQYPKLISFALKHDTQTHTARQFLSEYGTEEQPEKWAILRTPENAEMVNAFGNQKLGKKSFDNTTRLYLHYPGLYLISMLASEDGYTLITDEQFKRIAGIKPEPEEKYKVGQWLLHSFKGEDYLFRFDGRVGEHFYVKEGYYAGRTHEIGTMTSSIKIDHDHEVSVPTPDQIQSILSRVAEWKGLVNGVTVKRRSNIGMEHVDEIGSNKYVYQPFNDTLIVGYAQIAVYNKGVWATIVEKPEVKEIETEEQTFQRVCEKINKWGAHSNMLDLCRVYHSERSRIEKEAGK